MMDVFELSPPIRIKGDEIAGDRWHHHPPLANDRPMIGMSGDDGCGEPGEGGISLLRFPSKRGEKS
jgi:hypothetical protein